MAIFWIIQIFLRFFFVRPLRFELKTPTVNYSHLKEGDELQKYIKSVVLYQLSYKRIVFIFTKSSLLTDLNR